MPGTALSGPKFPNLEGPPDKANIYHKPDPGGRSAKGNLEFSSVLFVLMFLLFFPLFYFLLFFFVYCFVLFFLCVFFLFIVFIVFVFFCFSLCLFFFFLFFFFPGGRSAKNQEA